jgi:hypothetical protein
MFPHNSHNSPTRNIGLIPHGGGLYEKFSALLPKSGSEDFKRFGLMAYGPRQPEERCR